MVGVTGLETNTPNKNYSLFCLVNTLFDPFFTVFGGVFLRYFR